MILSILILLQRGSNNQQVLFHILLHAHANLHERVVDERPGSRSLQHVVQVVLEPPVAHVSPATLRAVDERFAEQAEPGSLLHLETLGADSTCCGRG